MDVRRRQDLHPHHERRDSLPQELRPASQPLGGLGNTRRRLRLALVQGALAWIPGEYLECGGLRAAASSQGLTSFRFSFRGRASDARRRQSGAQVLEILTPYPHRPPSLRFSAAVFREWQPWQAPCRFASVSAPPSVRASVRAAGLRAGREDAGRAHGSVTRARSTFRCRSDAKKLSRAFFTPRISSTPLTTTSHSSS